VRKEREEEGGAVQLMAFSLSHLLTFQPLPLLIFKWEDGGRRCCERALA